MRVGQKLIFGFLAVAMLVGVVGLFGLNASKQIAISYSGLSEEFQEDVIAAVEASSFAKGAESHLMLYLTLDSGIDKEKFCQRHQSLEEQVAILQTVVTTPGGIRQVNKLKSASDDILRISNQLIEAHDSNPEAFDPKDYAELVRALNDAASAARKAGVEIARRRTIDAAVEASSFAKRAESHLMLYLTLDSGIDKEKFFQRHQSLEDEIAILEVAIISQQLGKLKSASDDILRIGNQLIEAHDNNPEAFDPKDHAESVKRLNGATSVVRKTAIEITRAETLALRINGEKARKNATSIQHNIVTLIVVTVITALGIGGIISRTISIPIRKLRDATVQIGKGNFDIQLDVKSNDEIGQLAASFKKMTEDLTTSMDNLNREVSVRKKTERALERLNRDLESTVQNLSRSNKELKDFAHIIAHDLKAPLRAVGTLTDWISTDYRDKFDQRGKERIKLLKGRVMRMNELIDSILRYAEIGRASHKTEKVNMNELIAEVLAQIALPQNIEITIENELPSLICEKIRLIQVFQNLLSNAIKYMDKPQGRVRIRCVEENSFWKFSVSDNGPGIEEEYFEKIFQIFQTLLPRDEFESTGIGLTEAKKIIGTYGGRIWVESKVGEGTTFFFTLPKQEMRPKDAKLEPGLACRR